MNWMARRNSISIPASGRTCTMSQASSGIPSPDPVLADGCKRPAAAQALNSRCGCPTSAALPAPGYIDRSRNEGRRRYIQQQVPPVPVAKSEPSQHQLVKERRQQATDSLSRYTISTGIGLLLSVPFSIMLLISFSSLAESFFCSTKSSPSSLYELSKYSFHHLAHELSFVFFRNHRLVDIGYSQAPAIEVAFLFGVLLMVEATVV